MSMNSFSFKAAVQQHRHAHEEEISELLNLYPEGSSFPADPIQNLNVFPYQPIESQILKETWQDKKGCRRPPRYDLNFTVLVANHRKAFRTESENISASGLLLKDRLPVEFCQHLFDIVLVQEATALSQKSFFFFRGQTVDGIFRSRRVKFHSITSDSIAKLHQLLQSLKPTG